MTWNIIATLLFVPFVVGGIVRLLRAHEKDHDATTTVPSIFCAAAIAAVIVWRIWA